MKTDFDGDETGGGKLLHRAMTQKQKQSIRRTSEQPVEQKCGNKGPRRNEEKAGEGQIKSPMIRTSIKSKSAMKLNPSNTSDQDEKTDPKQSVTTRTLHTGPGAKADDRGRRGRLQD